MRRRRQNFSSSLVWVGAESAINILAAVCMTLVVGRIIGPTEFGLAAVAYLVGSLAEVLVITPFYDPLIQRRRLDAPLLNAGFTAMVGMGVATYLVILLIAPLLAFLYDKPALTALLAVQGTTCLFTGLRGAPEAMLARKLRFRMISVRSIVAKVVAAVLAMLAAVLGLGAWSVIIGNVTFACISTVMVLLLIKRMPRFAFLPQQMASLFSFGLFSLLDAVLWTATSRVFSFLVGYYQGVRVLGELNIAFRINDTACALISVGANRLALPMLSRFADDRLRLEQAFLRGTRLISLIVPPVFLGLAFVSQEIIDIALGPDWHLAGHALVAVCIFSFLNFVRLLDHATVKAVGKPWLMVAPNVIGLLYITAGCVVFRNAGFEAMLGVWIGFGIVFVLCSLAMVKKAIGTGWVTQLKPLTSIAAPSLAMCSVLYGVTIMAPFTTAIGMLLLKIALGGSTYLILLFLLERPLVMQFLSPHRQTAVVGALPDGS
jgi:O-antigen/teichoic acid export membrane protein